VDVIISILDHLWYINSDSDSVYWTCSQKAKNQKAIQTMTHCTTKQNNARQEIKCNAMRSKKQKKTMNQAIAT